MSREPNLWQQQLERNPGHSAWYVQRFRDLAARGDDLVGEARLIDALVPRRARILDAGCGPGRHSGYLHKQGHAVVGVDVDPVLIQAAREDHPGPSYLVGDLADLDLPAAGIAEPFDAILCAGNVLAFLAPSTRGEVLRRLAAHLADNGRLVTGFGAGRGYDFDAFLADAAGAGLTPQLRARSWELQPFTDTADYLVCVLNSVG